MSIEKPTYDLLAGGVVTRPRPPCIPDFVVRATGPGGAVTAVVAETMGFADGEYRARKRRLHPVMGVAVGAAAVVAHDFHEPAGEPQDWRDRRFWRETRWALTGSDASPPTRHSQAQ